MNFETNNTLMERPHQITVVNFPHGLCPYDIIMEMFFETNALNGSVYYPISKGISITKKLGLSTKSFEEVT